MRAGAALRSAMGSDIEARVGALDWSRIVAGLDAQGWAFIRQLLTARESKALADLYESGARFRSQVVMARHGFGRGEYKYFDYPLLNIVSRLRTSIYSYLAPLANGWNEAMASRRVTRRFTLCFSNAATGPARPDRRRYCCGMARATTIACIRTYMGSMYSRSK
jgi:hypothetical protein